MAVSVRKIKKEDVYPVDGFSTTVQHVILMCGNVDGNANKFYVMEIQTDDTDYRIYSEYGRIGRPNAARDLRENLSLADAEKEFARIKKIKMTKKSKTRKIKDGADDAQNVKHDEQYREVDIAAPTVGSPNIRAKCGIDGSTVATTTKSTGASAIGTIFGQMGYQAPVTSLLNELLRENVHQIEATSSVTVTHNGLETPLGPITHSHINTARDVLNNLQAVAGDGTTNARDSDNRQVRDFNNEFFSLVPHDHGRQFTAGNMLLTDDSIEGKMDLLRAMEAALTVTNADNDSKDEGAKLPLNMTLLSSKDEVHIEIAKRVRDTSKHNDVRNWTPGRVFAVNNTNETQQWHNPEPNGPVYDLFHGSANANLLSIMLKGFYIPPTSASHVTGRMFGNGVYGASSASKSFRYSVGLWGGQRSRMKTAYMFVVQFGMGNVYETSGFATSGAPRGYHSIHAKAGRRLVNDEFIVYDTRQAKITHLIEMSQ
jgi:poly [ADP-ribose] polymerase